MTLSPDPGGIFDSDAHRRVLAHLPLPSEDRTKVIPFIGRVAEDVYTDITEVELVSILGDLDTDEYASQDESGWKMTQEGLNALTGPNLED